jgi:hypothetical protein
VLCPRALRHAGEIGVTTVADDAANNDRAESHNGLARGRHEQPWYVSAQVEDDTPLYTQTLRETPPETHPDW